MLRARIPDVVIGTIIGDLVGSGDFVRANVGTLVGLYVGIVGVYVGDFDGDLVGNLLGYLDGYLLGFAVSAGVEFIVSALYVRFIVGWFEGIILGCNVGYFEGDGLFIDENVGGYKYEEYSVGLSDGIYVGNVVGIMIWLIDGFIVKFSIFDANTFYFYLLLLLYW